MADTDYRLIIGASLVVVTVMMYEKHSKYELTTALSHFQVDYASEPVMLYKPQKVVIRRSFHYGIWLQHRTSPHQTQLHVMLHRLQVSVSAAFLLCLLSLQSIANVCERLVKSDQIVIKFCTVYNWISA